MALGTKLLDAIFELVLERRVGLTQQYHVHQKLLRILDRTCSAVGPVLPYQLYTMLEVVPRCEVHRRELPQPSSTITPIVEHLSEGL